MHVDQKIQRGLFLFACTNSCMNPIVYGVFNIRARRTGGGQVRPPVPAPNCPPARRKPIVEISLKTLE